MNQTTPLRKKEGDQIEAIRKVQHATEVAMEAVISYLKSTGSPTSEEARELIGNILEKYNCESPEGPIVAGGPQSVEPHEIGSGPLAKESPIVIDIYPRSRTTGYFADMSRTVCLGTPSTELQKMYNAVLTAQELAISMIKPGVKGSEIQAAVDKLFIERGYETSGKGKEFQFAEGFVHNLGHGVGLNIHESPKLGRNSSDILEEGDVIAVEPALYYRHLGGIRLEDLVLVTKNGVENLTHFPKQFKL